MYGKSQLNGSYTIGGSTSDYTDITAAVNDLYNTGISGPVQFNIMPGSYYEQVLFNGAIPGSTSSNNVVFTSSTNNANDVEILYAPSSDTTNYIFLLDSVSNLTFMNLTFTIPDTASYGRIFDLRSESNNITFDSNIFNGLYMSSTSDNYALIYRNELNTGHYNKDINIYNNDFYGGVNAIHIWAQYNVEIKSIRITGNRFFNNAYYAISVFDIQDNYTSNHEAITVIKDNYIYYDQNFTSKGIYISYAYDSLNVSNNIIICRGSCDYTGMEVSNCQGSTPPLPLQVWANNIIDIDADDMGRTYGIVVTNGGHQMVVNNSVILRGQTTNNDPKYTLEFGYEGDNVNIINNDFVNYYIGSNSFCIHSRPTNSPSFEVFDNNNIYGGSAGFANYLGSIYASQNDFVIGTGYNSNGINEASGFAVDSNNIAYAFTNFSGLGYNLSAHPIKPFTLNNDYNYDPRNISTPAIGAIEQKMASLTIQASSTDLCENDSVQLSTSEDYTNVDYYWTYEGDTLSTENQDYFIPSQSSYYNGTISIGDVSLTDSVLLNVYAFPVIDIEDTNVCEGDTVTFTLDTTYTYLWSNGMTTSTISLDTANLGTGTHTIYVTVTNGTCNRVDSAQITFDICSSIQAEINDNELTIYPNPTNHILSMNCDEVITKIEIITFDGNIIRELFLNNLNPVLDISDLNTGIYLLKVFTGKNIYIRKLIKQ